MSLQSEVICYGTYTDDLKDIMPYDKDKYSPACIGHPVIVKLFYCETRTLAEETAETLGVHIRYPNTHRIRKENVNWDELRRLHPGYKDWYPVAAFKRLLDAGFTCMFYPDY